MAEHVFRFKRGDTEFEVRGDRDFVERAVERFAVSLTADSRQGAGSSVQAAPISSASVEEGRVPGHLPDLSSQGFPLSIRVRKNISFEDFLKLKAPKTSLDRLLTLAYFLEKYEGQGHYGTTELDQAWAEAFPDDAFSSALCDEALKRGYVEEVGGHLTLTFSGEAYVQNGLADRFR